MYSAGRPPESALHLLAEFRHFDTQRIWTLEVEWTSQPSIPPKEWQQSSNPQPCSRRPMRTITSFGKCGRKEMRVFRQGEGSSQTLMAKIKDQATVWALGGAKDLSFDTSEYCCLDVMEFDINTNRNSSLSQCVLVHPLSQYCANHLRIGRNSFNRPYVTGNVVRCDIPRSGNIVPVPHFG